MFFKEKLNLSKIIRVLLLFAFLLVSMKSSIFALNSHFNSTKNVDAEKTVKTVENSRCGLEVNSCCCNHTTVNQDCCCTSDQSGNDLLKSKFKKINNGIYNVFISRLKCSSIPGYFQSGSLSDFEPLSIYVDSSHIQEGNYILFIKSDFFAESHLALPFKPPRNNFGYKFNILT